MLEKIKSRLSKAIKNNRGHGHETPVDKVQLMEEFADIKEDPMQITGGDFDRAFAFLDKYPDSKQAELLIEEMKNTDKESLKGLSYESAVNLIIKIPDHSGAEEIISSMYDIEEEHIKKLNSHVLIFMLEIMPEHPYAKTITQAIVEKNFTNAYSFITKHPEHPHTRQMIREMFRQDANIAVLLLQEKMDHPQTESIIEGIYDISLRDIRKLTPNAVIFILEIAPDHQYAERLINQLVEENYIKALEFVKEHMEYSNSEMMVNAICKRKPELKDLF